LQSAKRVTCWALPTTSVKHRTSIAKKRFILL